MKTLNKYLVAFFSGVVVVASLCGCKNSSAADEFFFLSQQTTSDKWVESSFSNGSILSMRKDLSYENGTIVARVDSGTGDSARINLSCGNIGMKNPATGINIDVYLNENIDSAGIQWWTTNVLGPNRFYWVYINRHGCFGIHKTDNTLSSGKEQGLKYIQQNVTGINISGYNSIRVCRNSLGGMDFYLNGKLMYTIENKDLMYEEGNFFIVYNKINKQVYNSSNVGIAKFVLKGAQYAK